MRVATTPLVPADGGFVVSDGTTWIACGESYSQVYLSRAPGVSAVDTTLHTQRTEHSEGVLLAGGISRGFTVQLELTAWGQTAHTDVDELVSLWDQGTSATAPWTLTTAYGGVMRTSLGAPRKRTVDWDLRRGDVAQLVLEWESISPSWWGELHRVDIPFAASSTSGGWVFPLVFPIATATTSSTASSLEVRSGPAPLRITITGPIVHPQVSFSTGHRIELQTSLEAGESVTVDGRPWSLGVTDNTGASRAGALSLSSTSLTGLALPRGIHSIAFQGNSTLATATCAITWRDRFAHL